MRYKISFGRDGAAIVDTRKNDVDDMIVQALGMGVGKAIPMRMMESAWKKAKDKGDPSAMYCSSALQWSNMNTDLRYIKRMDVFVDTRNIIFRPMPPNAMLGPVSKDGKVRFEHYRSNLR